MKIRRFSSATVPEALAEVRRELGDDAVILATRKARGEDGFEVLVAVDDEEPALAESAGAARSSRRVRARAHSGQLLSEPRRPASAGELVRSAASVLEVVSPEPRRSPVGSTGTERFEGTRSMEDDAADVAPGAERPRNENRASLLSELEALRGRLEMMTGALLRGVPQDLSAGAQRLHLRLSESGFDARLATALLRKAEKAADGVERGLDRALAAAVRCGGELELGVGQQIVALVGPTGVGKTTTAAKLAARWLLRRGCSVALLSADGFRVGGSTQLGFYGEILEVPFFAVHDRKSFRAAIAACGTTEVILVDTTGRGPSDSEGVDEIQRLLASDPRTQAWLVLSAVAKIEDHLAALRTFGRLRPSGLVITKLDETSAPGAVFTAAVRSALPLRYLTDGQTVPDDLRAAKGSLVSRLVLPDLDAA
jgi:flagellar biosynthesis protein FlhF